MSSSSPAKSRVVILGCGYAGTTLISILEKHTALFDVTVVERRQFFTHKIAGVRAAVLGGKWIERTLIPLDKATTKVRLVYGVVKKVMPQGEKVVVVWNDPNNEAAGVESIPFDFLICATGTRNNCPADLPEGVRTFEEARRYYATFRDAIHRSSKIAMIGGGPVSLELAGEIRDAYDYDSVGRKEPIKEIEILSAGSELFSSNIQPVSPSFFKNIQQRLDDLEINIKLNSRVVEPSMRDFAIPMVEGERNILLASGNKTPCDLLILCAGWTLQTSFYPPEWLTALGEVVTSEHLHVAGRYDVFALGDITSLIQTKLAGNCTLQGPTLVKNLIIAAKELQKMRSEGLSTSDSSLVNQRLAALKYESAIIEKTTNLCVTMGPHYGVSFYNGYVLGSFSTRMIKGKGLYSGEFFAKAKKPLPSARIRYIDFQNPPLVGPAANSPRTSKMEENQKENEALAVTPTIGQATTP